MKTDRELMQQALKALVYMTKGTIHGGNDLTKAAITALRERLAQPVQKPKPSATGPAELWLQLHGDSLSDEPVDFTDDTVTWCWHQIFDSDVRYVRADLAAQQPVFHLRSHGDVSAEELERLAQPVQDGWHTHDLYTDADKDRPDVICDRNGSVTLGLCKRCGRGEVQLYEPCDKQPVQEPWPDEPPGHIAGGVQQPVAWSWEHDGRVVNAFPFRPDAESEYWKTNGWTTRPLVYGDTALQPAQQPVQEPVAMRYDFDGYGYKYIDRGSGSNWQTRIKDAEPLYAAPVVPEQEPFCYHDGRNIVGKEYADHSDVFPLYTAPQPRQWQGLTDEEKAELDAEYGDDTLAHLDAIEAKLREKNA